MAEGTRIVYVIEQDGYVKIGSTTNLKSRLSQLQTGCAVPIRLVGTCSGGFAREKWLQREFGAWRRHGEWFKFPPDVLATLMLHLTVATRPVEAVAVAKGEWVGRKNEAWSDRRRRLQRAEDKDRRESAKTAAYRRMPSRTRKVDRHGM